MKKYNANSGWKNESARHSLASKGVKTGRVDYSTRRQRRDALIGGGIGLLAGGVIGAGVGAGAGYIVGTENKKVDKASSSLSEFKLDNNYSIVAHSEDTRSGFRHIAVLMLNGREVARSKATYQNRTWESFEYQSVAHKLIDDYFKGDEADKYKKVVDSGGLGKVDSEFKTVAMVASLGEIFGKDKKEKNDWKLRMMKAGLESKGLQIPDDWETLSEDAKEKRLNMMIKFMKDKKIDNAKIKGWKKSMYHGNPDTKLAWDSVDKDSIEIRHVPSSNIPYKIVLNDIKEIDSVGTFEKAKKRAVRLMKEGTDIRIFKKNQKYNEIRTGAFTKADRRDLKQMREEW
jgi:hypothetical protein